MTAQLPAPIPERAKRDDGQTFWRIARRPKWIAVLLLVLVIAGAFAWLGRWQLERAIDSSRSTGPDSETAVPLDSVASPQVPIDASAAWRMVSDELSIVPGDTVLVSGRTNDVGPGWWVVAHAIEPSGASLAVAVGWAPTEDAANAALATVDRAGDLGTVTGRYLPTESPQDSDFTKGVHSALATAELVNEWHQAGPVYGGYLVLAQPLGGLVAIDAPAPEPPDQVNLLNLFYAIEWVVFAGGAVFLWWRLVRDEVEKEADAARAPGGDEDDRA